VSFARGLYERFRHLIHEMAKFGVIGLTGVVITDLSYNLLRYSIPLGPLTSVTIATIAASFFTFAGNRYWTFRHRQGSGAGRETILFFGLNGVALLIQYACIGLTNYTLGRTDKLSNNIALLIGIGLGTLFRFWSYRKWVWIAAPPAEPAALPPVPAAVSAVSAAVPAAPVLAAHAKRQPAAVSRGPASPRHARTGVRARPGRFR
jgi:putative flippase GtrA